ncbi:hypothetical protein [Streptomyces sp. A1136]|nr:hypothetical protein [Streptomyces sp. A1136]
MDAGIVNRELSNALTAIGWQGQGLDRRRPDDRDRAVAGTARPVR